MNRIFAFAFLLAFAIGAFALKNSGNFHFFDSQEEGLTVTIGPDTTLCQPGARIDFRPTVSDPNPFIVQWSPGALVDDSTKLNTFGVFDTSATLELTVFTIADEELIRNGDFSQGNTGFTTDYQLGNSTSPIGILAQENTYAITINPSSVHRRFASCTNNAGTPQIMVVNGSGIPNNVWCQEVTVEPNTDYVFSAFLASMTDENPARLQFSINGTLLGEELEAAPTTCIWRQFFATWRSGASTRAEICIVNVNNNPAGNDFALDDISFRPLCVARDTIQVNVADLNPNWSGPARYCSDETPVALNSLLSVGATPGGEWTLDGAPTDTLDPSAITAGDHRLAYSVRQAQCVETQEQIISVLQVRSAGAAREPAQFCAPAKEIVQLAGRLEGADPGGAWTETSAAPSSGNAFNAAQGTFNLDGLAPGLYTFRYTQTAPAGCNSSETEISIRVDPAPKADAGPDMVFDCTVDMLTIGGSETSTGSNFSYQWTSLGGAAIDAPAAALTEISRADTYVLKVTNDQTGCAATDTVVVSAQQEPPSLSARTNGISCPGADDGRIIIDGITGGRPPYRLTVNGNVAPTNQPIAGLAPGAYVLVVEDANGCTDMKSFNLADPPSPALSIAQQAVGDSVALRISTDLALSRIAGISWTPGNLNCAQCLNITVATPGADTEYAVRITDSNGCAYEARITVKGKSPVEQAEALFIPNAFSPNEDGENDYFTIFSAKGKVANIKMLQIADRWGNLLFSRQNIPPDEPSAGWDGLYKGQKMNPGVFVYIAEVEMTDGTSVLVQGDVVLVR